MGLHSSILQGCMCQYSMQAPPQRTWVELQAPPQRTWVGLTDEEIEGVYQSLQLEDYIRKQDRIDFARAILRKAQNK